MKKRKEKEELKRETLKTAKEEFRMDEVPIALTYNDVYQILLEFFNFVDVTMKDPRNHNVPFYKPADYVNLYMDVFMKHVNIGEPK